MKTYKNGISLIVLVITVIVLAILATTVIISLSNTNIISEASKTTFKSDMANLKTTYELYVASKVIEDNDYDRTSLNLSAISNATKFTEIFGENVPDKYKNNLEIVAGRLVYKTAEPEFVSVLKDLNMAITVIPTTLAIGDIVVYTPTANPSLTYPGATYVKDTVTTSPTYNTYIESTKTYTPGSLKWVYLGQDENGNALLTSQEATNFNITIAGQDGWVTGPDRIDTLCNTLYGNSTYGIARNMKIEDVNRVLGYNGPKGTYYGLSSVETNTPMTFGAIETKEGITIGSRKTPRLSTTAFEDYLSNSYSYDPTTYKSNTTSEYRIIFKKADGTTNQSTYWLSSPVAFYNADFNCAGFSMRMVLDGEYVSAGLNLFFSTDSENSLSYALRPIIVLNSNIQFEDNSSGEWKLVAI